MSFSQPSGESTAAAHALPRHVAVIMDGNGRWAQKRLLSRIFGHEKGADAVREVVRTCRELGIPFLTLYAFSTENWQRPQVEIAALMGLLRRFVEAERAELIRNHVRLHVIGCIERLPEDLQKALRRLMEETASNSALQLNLALSYGGRDDILQAVRDERQYETWLLGRAATEPAADALADGVEAAIRERTSGQTLRELAAR